MRRRLFCIHSGHAEPRVLNDESRVEVDVRVSVSSEPRCTPTPRLANGRAADGRAFIAEMRARVR